MCHVMMDSVRYLTLHVLKFSDFRGKLEYILTSLFFMHYLTFNTGSTDVIKTKNLSLIYVLPFVSNINIL